MSTTKCGRRTESGDGSHWECELRQGHSGDHRATWVDRDGVKRLGLQWRFEKDGYAVWPGTPGAVKVTA